MGRPLGSDGSAQPDLSNHLDEDSHETRSQNASALSQETSSILGVATAFNPGTIRTVLQIQTSPQRRSP